MTDIVIPNVGESVSEVTIAVWMKQAGDTVKKDDPIVEIETDKASQELVAPEDGVLSEILVAEGDTVAVGTLIAKMGEGSGEVAADKGDAEVKAQTETASSTETTGSSFDIDVPNVGESVSEVTVASWMVGEGDAVDKDQPIVELETDKAAQELVAPRAGVITEILVSEGDVATIGQTLARMGESNSAPATETAKTTDAVEKHKVDGIPGTNIEGAPNDVHIMPAAAKIIRENDLDAAKIKGTGKDGRILKDDARKALEAGTAKKSAPAPSAPKPPAVPTPAPTVPSAPREPPSGRCPPPVP